LGGGAPVSISSEMNMIFILPVFITRCYLGLRCGIKISWDNKKSEMVNRYLSCEMPNY